MSKEIRYLDMIQIDFSKISIKEQTILYQYPDGIIKKLYIKTPYLRIIRSKAINKIHIDITNIAYFFEELDKRINELRNDDTINKLCNYYKNEKGEDKIYVNMYFNKNKSEIIKHNISPKYKKMEIIKENIDDIIKKINSPSIYVMEGMCIFAPVIYMNNNILISYKMEIKYKNQNIKSYIQSKEVDIDYIDKYKKIIIFL